jgi:hypothetical protein
MNKEQLMSIDETESVDIPEWKDSVRLKPLNAKEALDFIDFCESEPDGLTQQFRLCVLTMVDDDGNQIFQDDDEGIDFLRNRSGKAVNRIVEAALRINGLDKDLEKN